MTKAATVLYREHCPHPSIQCVLLQKKTPAISSPCLLLLLLLLPPQYQAFLSVAVLSTMVFLCMALAN